MLKELLKQKLEVEGRIADLQATIEPALAEMRDQICDINLQIGTATQDKLKELRTLQAKQYGVVHLVMGGVKVSETVSKRVTWDQAKLGELFTRIQASGDEPRNYMKMKLEVGEKEFDKFAPGIKDIFAEARTVTPGVPTIKFEEVADA